MVRTLTADEESFAATLTRAGLRPPEARCLALLLRGGAFTRSEVARATDLLPQDVSIAMRRLDERGAARLEARRDGAPGRPAMRYHLATDAARVLAELEQERRAALAAEAAALDEVRAKAATLTTRA